jgi:release factor glutamine methyltransferase
MVYPVSEDSIFLSQIIQNFLKKNKERKSLNYLDMGAGSGFLAEIGLKSGISKENILCADIDSECVKIIRKKGFNCIKSNLFSRVKGKFDIISFNAPYLPKHKYDNGKDTTGGKMGDEVTLRFLRQAKKHIKKNGKVFLLISSLTPFNRIKRFKMKIVAKKKIFFEELIILEG